MFFKDRIKSLKPEQRVIDVGPGAFPFPGAAVYLEKRFSNPESARAHRSGYELPPATDRWVFYSGGTMPFLDHEFDYSICSHVLQMTEDLDTSVRELNRISRAGYVEFPLPTYDFLFDYDAHVNFVSKLGEQILWLPKHAVDFKQFEKSTGALRTLFERGYCDFVSDAKAVLFEGFEWSGRLESKRVSKFSDLFQEELALLPHANPRKKIANLLKTEVRSVLRKFGI